MKATVPNHPLIAERLTRLRKRETKRAGFRRNLHELSQFLIYEALRSQQVTEVSIDTPLGAASGVEVRNPPLVVPVLRAGLGMMEAAFQMLPNARVGFVGAKRDEETFLPDEYVNTVPDDLKGQPALVLDPMLATGGSLLHTCKLLAESKVGFISVVCVLAAPEGIAAVQAAGYDGEIVAGAIDSHLNEQAFIVPGLGDAGDRQFGLA